MPGGMPSFFASAGVEATSTGDPHTGHKGCLSSANSLITSAGEISGVKMYVSTRAIGADGPGTIPSYLSVSAD